MLAQNRVGDEKQPEMQMCENAAESAVAAARLSASNSTT
jgi:hypothetical protein